LTVGIAVAVVGVSLLGVFTLGIIAAIAIPGILRARMAGNEASAIGSLRAVNAAEGTFAARWAKGLYAGSVEDLKKRPAGASAPFIALDMDGDVRNGYRIRIGGDGPVPYGGGMQWSSAGRLVLCDG